MTAATPEETAVRLRLALTRVARRLRQNARGGLGPSQASALATIAAHGPLTPSRVAEREGIKRPTVTRIVAALEEIRFVVREPDPADRRSCLVDVSVEGRAYLDEVRSRKDAYVRRWLETLDEEDREVMHRAALILTRLTETAPPDPDA
ncbi:MAG: MarR family transcriptional regulator [Solirubrobacteraceae bacterium]|nr:MarR family transcriptional regulator [Solirubrobacteraceae bacterium]